MGRGTARRPRAVKLRQDQVDLTAALACEPPVTGDPSCIYRIEGTVFDVDLTYRNGRPSTQTLWVELDDRTTIGLEPQRVQPLMLTTGSLSRSGSGGP